MKLTKGKILFLVFCISVPCILLVTPILQPAPDQQQAINNAINYFENPNDPHTILMLDVIYRRFGINKFEDSLQRYDQILFESPDSMLRLFRRIADNENQIQERDLQVVIADLDYILIHALYCDINGLSADYLTTLNHAIDSDDYLLTHALLACIWIQENGCESLLSEGLLEAVYSNTAKLINNDPVIEDIEIEAAAFLHLAGQGTLVDQEFINQVVRVQNVDGGWPLSSNQPDNSNEHTTVLALILLLHDNFPADSYPPMLDS